MSVFSRRCAPLFVLATLTLTASPVVAQKSLGIKAGYSRSSLFSFGETEHVSGFAASVEFDASRGGVLGGRFGAAYVQKGGAFWDRGSKIAMELDYVQLSSLLTAAVLRSDGTSGSMALFAGPWVAFRLSCGASAQRGGAALNVSNCGDVEDDLSAMDFGFALGIGFAFPISGGVRAAVDADYSLGLVDQYDDPEADRNRGLGVRAGVTFPVG